MFNRDGKSNKYQKMKSTSINDDGGYVSLDKQQINRDSIYDQHPQQLLDFDDNDKIEKEDFSKNVNWQKRWKIKFRNLMYHWKHYIYHTWYQNKRNKLSYLLGFSACFLVVFIVALCVSIISNTPVVFLSLSEASVGEMDIIIEPGSWTLSDQANYTLISQLLSNVEDDTYHTPRIISSVYTINAQSCPDGDLNSNGWKYHGLSGGTYCQPYCFDQVCSNSQPEKSNLYILDLEKEKRMGLGRDWNLPPPDMGSVYIQSSLASDLQVSKGDYLYIRILAPSVLSSIWTNANNSDNIIPIIYMTVKIQDTFDKEASGKYPSNEKSAIFMDYSTFIPFVVTQLDPNTLKSSLNFMNNTNLYDFAQSIVINLPPSRLEPYTNSNQDEILQYLIKFSSKILYKIGFNLLDSSLPIMNVLSKNRYVALFLGLILNVIIFILLFLSILLIYSLLMIDVETRSFEMGVMRMIGTTRSGIIQLMLFKAFSYSIPSWAIGLVCAQLFGFVVSAIFKNITGVPIPTKLSPESVLLASLLGFLIPIAASILPIRNALGKNLHDSLDVKHSKTMAVQITIERSEDNSFSSTAALIGFVLAAFGFGIYYIFPLSLLSFNLTLMLNMFFLLLIAMLLGLVSLALNLEQLLEKLVVMVFLFWEKQAIRSIIVKNLIAHKLRNRKTAVMYAISLGFIIFVNVSYSMQQTSMNYQVEKSYGTYLRVDSNNRLGGFSPTVPEQLESFFEANSDMVSDFSWISVSFSVLSPEGYQSQSITNIGHIYSDSTQLQSTSPNIFQTTLPGFLKASVIASDPDFTSYQDDDVTLQMYSMESSKKLIIGSIYTKEIGASPTQPFLMELGIKEVGQPINQTRYLVKPLAMLDSAPNFSFSKFPSVTGQDSLVAFTSFVSYTQGMYTSVRQIPMKAVLLKLNTDDEDTIANFKGKINAFMVQSGIIDDYSILNYYDAIEPNKTASNIIEYFFGFTTVVAMVISFFSLMSSMFTNIFEQTKEIGILRAIGIPKAWMIRIYIYESFVLVFSSSLMGVFIGTIVGWTLLLQRVLFTQLPIPFVFPWILLIVIFVCSIFFSFFSAFFPIRKILNLPVVNILRTIT
ncbi:DUF214 family protein [Tieghemostelium lacteum]|uniref:DUF214 family protein n=1 Tax=Tieghemostelium lacteum TaxID=361077 RepID=A0A151ZB89_TIELA|nr:DUF214 family protein [Tieghemostelium lacteum]|eukprot:KYQ91201.1 DUF214 family protein [Tieghemostelium lacteum]